MERCQGNLVLRLRDVLLERSNDVSKGRDKETWSVHLHDVWNKSQIKHPKTHQYVTKTSQRYESTTPH